MTTERMTDEHDLFSTRDALIEKLRKENASLRDQLRLANDKMAEQVRQGRWEVVNDVLAEPTCDDMRKKAFAIADANAPKD